MNQTVYVHTWADWARANSRTTSEVEWRNELKAIDVVSEDLRRAPGLTVHVNGSRLMVPELCALYPGSHVDISIRPAGIAIGAKLGAALVAAAVSAAVSFVLSLILPKPKGPKRRGDEESPNYAWRGSDNVRVEGQPRPLIFGEMRVAPQVIDEFVHTQAVPPRSDLYALLALGEGPIYSIGDVAVANSISTPLSTEDPANPLPLHVEINSNPASNYNGIEAHVRLGTNEQVAIPGFEEIHTLSTVGSTLTQQETGITSNAGTAWSLATFPFNSNDSTVQAVWNQYAQAFDLPGEADAYTITIQFTEGLYRIDNSGNMVDAYFQALVRYQQLDGGGSPITAGGDNGDGWIYVQPVPMLAAHQQSPFPYELSGSFVGPTGYTPGAAGRLLAGDTSGQYAYTAASNGGAAANASGPWSAGVAIDEFSFECWYKPIGLPSTGSGTSEERPIFEWLSSTPFKGFSLRLRRYMVDVGSETLQPYWKLVAQFGTNSSTVYVRTDAPLAGLNAGISRFSSGQWRHIAVTYKRDVSGTNNRVRIYVQGSLAWEYVGFFAPPDMVAPSSPMYLLRQINSGLTAMSGFGRMDEARVWSTERTPAQITASYNGGIGNFGASTSALVAGWHFDTADIITGFTYSNDFSSRNNDVTTAAGATIADSVFAADAVVFRPGTGTPTRARYRVQVMRFNLLSTATAIGDETEWETIDGRVDEQLMYPSTPLLGLKIEATDQLSGSSPRYTVVAKGLLCPVWDQVSTSNPTVNFKWTANPAWIVLLILTNRRFGRGGDFAYRDVDMLSFQEWADYCDEKLYDGRGRAEIDSADSAVAIANIRYDSTLFSGTGGLEILFRVGFQPPEHWEVGGFLGFTGVAAPPTSGIAVDVNVANISGLEIGEIEFASSSYTVRLKYDVAALGAPWSDGALLSTVLNPTAVTGSVEGREVRFRYDGILDTFTKVWDVLLQICGTARAVPVLDGRRIRIRLSKPRDPVGLVTHAAIEPGSFKLQYSSRLERPNSYVADFLDRDRNWQRATEERKDATLDAGSPEGAFNREHLEMQGVTRRSQVRRDLDFRLAVNRLLTRQGEFATGLEGLPYEPGDVVVLSHDLVPWGKSGRLPAASSSTNVTLDRAVTLEAATTYYLRVRMNAQGQTGSGSTVADYMETREITSVAGTYAAGATITIASAFTTTPAKDDPYLVYSEAEQFLAEIAEVTLTPDWKRRVRWIQYDVDAYDVDTLLEDVPSELGLGSTSGDGAATSPGAVQALELREVQRRESSGVWQPEIFASWVLDRATAGYVREVVVWARVGDGAWDEVARARGPATSARIRPQVTTAGESVEIAIQPVSERGSKLRVDRCRRARIDLVGSFVAPPAPTALTATLNGDQATYSWTPPADGRGLSYELRRGGWLLGHIVGVSGAGATSLGPTRDWSAGKANVAGDGPPRLYLRARDARGQYSEAAVLEGFNPAVSGSVVLVPPNVVGQRINGDQCWEDYGTGWSGGSPAPTLTGVQVTASAIDGHKYLEFDGSALSATYETVVGTIDADTKPERAYVEAHVAAVQVPPTTMADWTLPAGSPLAARRSFEGLLDAPKCTLRIQWRFKLKSTNPYGDWLDFSPGIYYFLAPQFRLLMTRIDTTWNVRVDRFGTRLSRIPPQKFEATQIAQHLAAEGSLIGV